MKCIRCGRKVHGDYLLCAECGGREPAQEPEPVRVQTAEKPDGPKPPKAKLPRKRRKIRSMAHRRLRRWLIAVIVLCVALAAAAGTAGYEYAAARRELAKSRANEEQLQKLQNEREALNATLLNAQTQLETAKTKISDQNSQLTALEGELAAAQSASSRSSASAEQLAQQVADLKTQNEAAVGQLKTQQEELEAQKAEKAELELQMEELEGELEQKQAEVDDLNRTVTRYKTQSTFFSRNVGFVCASDRAYYHSYGCDRLDLTGSWWLVRVGETRTYSPCPDCQ